MVIEMLENRKALLEAEIEKINRAIAAIENKPIGMFSGESQIQHEVVYDS